MQKTITEMQILGCLIGLDDLQDDRVTIEMLKVEEDYFSDDTHKRIFRCLKSIHCARNPVDLQLIEDTVPGTGGRYLFDLQDGGTALPNLYYATDKLIKEYEARKFSSLIDQANVEISPEMPADDILKVVEGLSMSLEDKVSQSANIAYSADVFKELAEYAENTEEEERIPTGDRVFDDLIGGGILKGSINVIAGLSSTGKTTFATKIISHLSLEQTHQTAFFSLEMKSVEITRKLLAHKLKMPLANLTKEVITNNLHQLDSIIGSNSLANIADRSLSIEEIYLKSKIIKSKTGLDIVVIDFLTALQTKKNHSSEYATINYIMSQIGRITEELNVAVILLAQLNREAFSAKDGKPAMNHLKGSSSIENFADYLIFVHREAVLKPDCGHNYLEVLLRKNRYGENGSVFYKNVKGTIFDTNQSQALAETGGCSDINRKIEKANKEAVLASINADRYKYK